MACNDPLTLDISPSTIRLVIPRGRDYGWINCTFKDSNGDAVDITSATFEGGIKSDYLDAAYLIEVEAEVVSGAAGTFRWRFVQADIDGLDCGSSITDALSQYVWDFTLITTEPVRHKLYRGPVAIQA
jgi:hypothetical protein